jgi:hypothetical protein
MGQYENKNALQYYQKPEHGKYYFPTKDLPYGNQLRLPPIVVFFTQLNKSLN